MTWASWDDQFTDMPVWDGVSYEARWHYIALVTFCCASHRWDGRMPWRQAERVSDVPNPHEAVKQLVAADLLADLGAEVELLYIDSHVPPEGKRPENLLPRKRQNQREYRRRRCEAGQHSKDCPPKTCPIKQQHVTERVTGNAAGNADVESSVTARVTGNAGTGRDGTGREGSTTRPSKSDSWRDSDEQWLHGYDR